MQAENDFYLLFNETYSPWIDALSRCFAQQINSAPLQAKLNILVKDMVIRNHQRFQTAEYEMLIYTCFLKACLVLDLPQVCKSLTDEKKVYYDQLHRLDCEIKQHPNLVFSNVQEVGIDCIPFILNEAVSWFWPAMGCRLKHLVDGHYEVDSIFAQRGQRDLVELFDQNDFVPIYLIYDTLITTAMDVFQLTNRYQKNGTRVVVDNGIMVLISDVIPRLSLVYTTYKPSLTTLQ